MQRPSNAVDLCDWWMEDGNWATGRGRETPSEGDDVEASDAPGSFTQLSSRAGPTLYSDRQRAKSWMVIYEMLFDFGLAR